MRPVVLALSGALILTASTIASAPAAGPVESAIASICTANAYAPSTGVRAVKMFPGMGTGGFKIDGNAEAQAWFDYGMKLYHAFYHGDAKLAFAKAVEADPNCAMCIWGQALAAGPNQNQLITLDQTRAAQVLAKKAEAMGGKLGQRDRDLLQALVARYEVQTPDAAMLEKLKDKPFEDRGNAMSFAARMQDIAIAHPDDEDMLVLAAHAWLTNRQDRAENGRKAMALLEQVLARSPDNSAAIHFYIHATEFAGQSQLAMPYAKKLAGLAPGSSHLVHMASHTFFRGGLYQDAAVVNADALGVGANYSRVQNAQEKIAGTDYYAHNYNFGISGALMSGDGPLAMKFADHMPVAWPLAEMKDTAVWTLGRAYIGYARYDPKAALAIADPGDKTPDRQRAWRYARGEAYAQLGDARGVKREAAAIKLGPKASPQEKVAKLILQGRYAMLTGKPENAVRAYAAAYAIQDKQLSNTMDPPPWWYPVHRSAAAAWLKAGNAEYAAQEANLSLATWPNDPMALLVLAQAEEKLGQTDAAQGHMEQARKAWRGDLSKVRIETI